MEELAPEPQLTQEDFSVRRYCLEMAHGGVVQTQADVNEILDVARDYYHFMTGTDPQLDQSNAEEPQMELPGLADNVIYLKDLGPDTTYD